MSSSLLTNSERFKKYRFGNASTHQSDSQIVCHGTLVTRHGAPDRFHRGWYPIRNCPHRPTLAAGVRSSKYTSFQNYHVTCDICDAPRHKEKGCQKKKDRIDCSSHSLLSCSSRPSSKKPQLLMANTHWRKHDPHMWMDKPQVCTNDRVHKTNWFEDMIKMGIHENQKRRLQMLQEKGNMQSKHGRVCRPMNNASDPKENKPVGTTRPSEKNAVTSNQVNGGGSQDKMGIPKEEQQS